MTDGNPAYCGNILGEIMKHEIIQIVYHWDADGVASASLITRSLPSPVYTSLATPRIGSYTADAIQFSTTGSSEKTLLLLDYGIPGDELDKLQEKLPANTRLAVIDHHAVNPPSNENILYCNPVAEGYLGEEDAPAASLLIYEILGSPRDYRDRELALLGVAGDLSPFIDSSTPHKGLDNALEATGLSPNRLKELRLIAERVDSCYRILDYSCLKLAVHAGASLGPVGISLLPEVDAAWRSSQSLLEKGLEKLERIESDSRRDIAVYKLVMDSLVTSLIGRKLASEHSSETVVLIHYIPAEKRGFIYVRRLRGGLKRAQELLRSLGVKVGGKDAVLVVEYSGEPVPSKLLQLLLEVLEQVL